jgi:hypothetical protein
MAEEAEKHESENAQKPPEETAEAAESVAQPENPPEEPASEIKEEVADEVEPQLITSEKVEFTQVAKIEKKPGFFKRLFKRKQSPPKQDDASAPKSVEKPALSQQEMSAKLAQLIDKQIAENSSGDFFVIRIRKQYFLLLAGFAILLMWFVALGKPDMSIITKWYERIKPVSNVQEPNPETAAVSDNEPSKPRIRIKYIESQQNQTESITASLASLGLDVVDVVVDPTLTETGYQFIAKPDFAYLAASISAALGDQVAVASGSTELSPDSDFDGVFIVGKLD